MTKATNAPSPQSSSSDRSTENGRIPLTSAAIKRGFLDHLYFTMGKYPAVANGHDLYMALSYTIRDRMMERWINTVQNYRQKDVRVVCYLSAEFLLGKHLLRQSTWCVRQLAIGAWRERGISGKG